MILTAVGAGPAEREEHRRIRRPAVHQSMQLRQPLRRRLHTGSARQLDRGRRPGQFRPEQPAADGYPGPLRSPARSDLPDLGTNNERQYLSHEGSGNRS